VIAATHCGVVGYKEYTAIIGKKGLPKLSKREFWNLERKERKDTLTRQEELEYILQLFEKEGVHVCYHKEYTLDSNREQDSQVIKDLFWMSIEQIKMAQWFVSGFMYKTDATFNTNCLKLPLSVIVDIDNCGKTFSIAYCYITSESAASFKFVAEQVTDLAFYNCPDAAVIVGDFSKGLRAAVAAKAAVDLRLTTVTEEALVCPLDHDKELSEAAEVVVYEAYRGVQYVLLQLCE
jgi:hypothetical protein